MMKLKYLYRLLFGFWAVLLFMNSCSDMNDLHDVYLRNGETIYTGRVDSAKVFAGNNRVLMRYWTSDIKATYLLVYWLSRTDSVMLDIPVKTATMPVDVYISDLPEGNLYFDLFTLNKNMKDRSIVYNLGGNVYGTEYQSSLLDRTIKTKVFNPITGMLTITWLGSVENSVGCEMEYTDLSGAKVTKRVPTIENTTVFSNVSGNLKYRTLFLPEKTAVDTFYTVFKSLTLN
jgi:hypothetical protein